jgi:low temperature requirement protein LtrA
MAGSIVNADFETYRAFSYSVIFQRVAFIALMVPVAQSIPKARYFAGCVIGWTAVACLLFLAAALSPEEYVLGFLTLAAAWEFFIEVGMANLLQRGTLVRINIEHSKERLGVLVLVMLGETVITSTITYKAYAEEADEGEDGTEYYTVMTLSFVLTFMYILLFFNQQPAAKDHALRRSKLAGVSLMILNKVLGLSLLTIGACMKLSVNAVTEGTGLTPFVSNAFRLSVGMSLVLLLAMRICHYGGKLPRPTDPPHVQRLMYVWWSIFALGCFVPFVAPSSSDPTTALAWPSGLAFVLVLIESWFTHVLEEHLPNEESEALYHYSNPVPSYDATK